MPLKITNREVDGVTVLALDGRIVLGEETSTLREKVKSLLGEGKKNIVLNLNNVTLIDSSGLGALVAFVRQLSEAGPAHSEQAHLGGCEERVDREDEEQKGNPKTVERFGH